MTTAGGGGGGGALGFHQLGELTSQSRTRIRERDDVQEGVCSPSRIPDDQGPGAECHAPEQDEEEEGEV